jgi:hypothetical protein
MAVTFNTDQIDGLIGTTINGVYARIQSIIVKKYDATTDPDVAAHWMCLYDVVLHNSASTRNAAGEYPEWPNRLRSRVIDHMGCAYDPTSNSNPYAQAYANLKARLAAGDSPIATSISDA